MTKEEVAVLLDDARDLTCQLPCQIHLDQLPAIQDVSLGEAVLLNRRARSLNWKNEAPSGHQVVWNGYFQLTVSARTLERLIRHGDLSAQKKLVVQ